MKCACEFKDEDGTPLGLCKYHGDAMKFVAKQARDKERERIAVTIEVDAAKSRILGHPELSTALHTLAKQTRFAKAPIHVAVLKSCREDLLR